MSDKETQNIDVDILDKEIIALIAKHGIKGYVLLLEGENGNWKKGYWKLENNDLSNASRFLNYLSMSDIELNEEVKSK